MRGKASVSRHARHVCLSNIAILRAMCQRNHWPKHKNPCKQGASKLHDEALFKDYSYTQIKRADQQLAWRRRRSNFRGKLTYISSRIRSIGVFRHLESEYHSEFTSPQTRHSVTQCTWASSLQSLPRAGSTSKLLLLVASEILRPRSLN